MRLDVEKISDVVYCTIITKSHLAYARVLATTLAEHNPQSKLFVLLADRIDGYFDPDKEPFELIYLDELSDQEDIQKMCFYYTPSELCMALRAWLHEYMFQKTTVEKWVYLDTDIMVSHSLQRISEQLDTVSILLSPHILYIHTPPSINVKAVRKLESLFLRCGGIYNGGFLALRRTEETKSFIDYFKDRLRLYAFDDRPMQFVDQFWLGYVPLYFREVSVLRDPGANLAYWNLYERKIEENGLGKVQVNDEPLLFFHFAGFDVNTPGNLTKYAIPQGLNIIQNPIRKLAKSYRRLLIDSGYEETKNYPYAFANFENGQKITPMMRRLYFNEYFNDRECKGSPFEQHAYFQSRLRSKRIRNSFGRLFRNIINRIRKMFNPDYEFDLP